MHLELILKTKVPVNPMNVAVFFDTIEFEIPETFRMEFSLIKTYITKEDESSPEDDICKIKIECRDFDYEAFKDDYDELGLKEDDFNYDHLISIMGNADVTFISVNCVDTSTDDDEFIPTEIERVRFYFDEYENPKVIKAIDVTARITSECKAFINYE